MSDPSALTWYIAPKKGGPTFGNFSHLIPFFSLIVSLIQFCSQQHIIINQHLLHYCQDHSNWRSSVMSAEVISCNTVWIFYEGIHLSSPREPIARKNPLFLLSAKTTVRLYHAIPGGSSSIQTISILLVRIWENIYWTYNMVNWDSLLRHDNVKSRLLYGKIFIRPYLVIAAETCHWAAVEGITWQTRFLHQAAPTRSHTLGPLHWEKFVLATLVYATSRLRIDGKQTRSQTEHSSPPLHS